MFINSGFDTASVFIATLSAPLFKINLISSIVLRPPPTVRGIEIFLAALSTTSRRLLRPYKLATELYR